MATNWYSAPAPVARRVRGYFAPVNRAAQTPVLFDPAEQGGFSLNAPPLSVDQPGLDSGVHAKSGEQERRGVDGDSGQRAGAGAGDAGGAGEFGISELDQADHGLGDGFAAH